MEIFPFQEIVMDSSPRHLVDGELDDERQSTGVVPVIQHENEHYYPPDDAPLQFPQAL